MGRAAHLKLESGERRVLAVRRHWWLLLRPALGMLPFLLALPAYAITEYVAPAADLHRYTSAFVGVDLVLLAVLLLKWLALDFSPWLADVYVITNRRVIEQRGVLTVVRREASLRSVQESNYSISGAEARLFAYGDLTIQTGGRGGSMVFRQVPQPRRIQTLLSAQARAAREEYQSARKGNDAINAALHRVFSDTAPIHDASTEAVPRISRGMSQVQRRVNLLPGETVIHTTRRHPFLLIRTLPLPILIAAAGVVSLIFATRLAVPHVWLALFGVALFWSSWCIVDWRDDLYVLTSDRLMELQRTPLFFELRNVVQLRAVRDVALRISSLSGRLFNVGTLTVELGGSGDPLLLRAIPHPDRMQRLIFEQLDEAIQRDKLRDQERLAGTLTEWFQEYHRMQGGPPP